MRLLHIIALGLGLVALAACTTVPKLEPRDTPRPVLIMEEFFPGTTRGSGYFLNSWTGSKRNFDVVIEGSWDGEVLTLVEDFEFEDGETDTKTWRLTKKADGTYEGTREDVVGTATGTQDGPLFLLSYRIRLGDLTVRFNDVLGLRDDGTLVNRAIVSKWGVRVARVYLELTRDEE